MTARSLYGRVAEAIAQASSSPDIVSTAIYMAGMELGLELAIAQPETAAAITNAMRDVRGPDAWWLAAGLQAMSDAVEGK